MSNKFSWKDNWDDGVTELDIFKEENNTSRNKKPIDTIAATETEYTDTSGVADGVYKVAPKGTIPWGQIKFESYANVLYDNSTYSSPITKPAPTVSLNSGSNILFNNTTYGSPLSSAPTSTTSATLNSGANVIYTGTTYSTPSP